MEVLFARLGDEDLHWLHAMPTIHCDLTRVVSREAQSSCSRDLFEKLSSKQVAQESLEKTTCQPEVLFARQK